MGSAGESTRKPCICPPPFPVHPSRGTCPSCVGLTSSVCLWCSCPLCPRGIRVLHGGGQGHRKCLLGACGPGQSWQQARGGKDILRSLRNLHSPLLLPPPPYPQLQRRRALGRGGVKLQSQRPAACPGCGGQSRPWHWTGGSISTLSCCPPLKPAPLPEWAGHRG